MGLFKFNKYIVRYIYAIWPDELFRILFLSFGKYIDPRYYLCVFASELFESNGFIK